MPYNSSSFEKQLERYKNEQASKRAAETRRDLMSEAGNRGMVQPNRAVYATINKNDISQSQRNRPEKLVLDTTPAPKPLLKRGGFLFLMITVVSTLLSPVLFKDQIEQFMGMAHQIKSTTGVDPLSPETYKRAVLGAPAEPLEEASMPMAATPTPEAIQPIATIPAGSNMTDAVSVAQQKAHEISAQGPEKSLQYIELETQRLNAMAKQFDEEHRK